MLELDFHTQTFLLKMISADKRITMCIVFPDYYSQDDQRELLCAPQGLLHHPEALPHMATSWGFGRTLTGQYEDQTV